MSLQQSTNTTNTEQTSTLPPAPPQLTQQEEIYAQSNSVLSKIVRFEFMAEQIINYLSRSNKSFFTQQRFLELLSVLELVKIFYKYKKFKQRKIYLSEDNLQVEEDAQQQKRSSAFEKFFSEDYTTKYKQMPVEELKKTIFDTLERIKSHAHQSLSFNAEYSEELQRSKKRVQLLTKLPIPQELMEFKDEGNIFIQLGEQLFMIRPFIYSLCLRIFGTESYIPYFVSMVIDSCRLIMQRNVKYYRPSHKEEFKQRNKEMILNYLLRSPFYERVFKKKVLIPMLDNLIGNRLKFLKDFILGLIEMRCSICLLL